jgi:hypothetical protein
MERCEQGVNERASGGWRNGKPFRYGVRLVVAEALRFRARGLAEPKRLRYEGAHEFGGDADATTDEA